MILEENFYKNLVLLVSVCCALSGVARGDQDLSVGKFCRDAGELNAIVGFKKFTPWRTSPRGPDESWKELLDSESFESVANHYTLFIDSRVGPVARWYATKHPGRGVRNAVFNSYAPLFEEVREAPIAQDFSFSARVVDRAVYGGLTVEAARTIETRRAYLEKVVFGDRRVGMYRTPVKRLMDMAPAICAEFSVLLPEEIKKCAEAVRTLTLENDTLVSTPGKTVTSPKLWIDFQTDLLHAQALNSFAKEILGKVEVARRTGVVTGNFYDDLFRHYVRFAPDRKVAEDKMWIFLGLYGGRGPIIDDADVLLPAALDARISKFYAVVTVGLSVLDSYSIDSGFLYSLPSAYGRTTCLTNKPYHFWFSAYAIHSLLQHGFPARIAKIATYINGNLYDFGTTAFHDPGAYYKRPALSVENNITRLSMASRRLGLDFAAEPMAKSPRLDLDSILKKMVRNTEVETTGFVSFFVGKFFGAQAADYTKFRDIFSLSALNPYREDVSTYHFFRLPESPRK